MKTGKQPHILNAASNLMGICFVIVTALKITGNSERTLADEISMAAALCYMGSCLLSYLSLRSERRAETYERLADYLFIAGMFLLFTAVLAFGYDLF